MSRLTKTATVVFDAESIRKDFPVLSQSVYGKPLVYLDNAATSQKPQPVIDAVVNYYTYLGANAHRGDYEMSAQVDAAFEGARVPRTFHIVCRLAPAPCSQLDTR